MIDQSKMPKELKLPQDPFLNAGVNMLCGDVLLALHEQDPTSARRYGVFDTCPLPPGKIFNGDENLGLTVGGLCLFCQDAEKRNGWCICIYLGIDEKFKVIILPAKVGGEVVQWPNEKGIKRVKHRSVSMPELTKTIDGLTVDFLQNTLEAYLETK